MYLKNHGLKRYSTPFDWIGLGLDEINNILETRFSRFIDPAFLIDHADGDGRKCGHSQYGDRLFHHFNPRKNEDRDYYLRCIERFCRRPAADDIVLYIYKSFYADPPLEELRRLRNNLAIYRGNYKFITLVFIHRTETAKDTPQFRTEYCDPTLWVVYTDLVGNINGVHFLDKRDDDAMTAFLASHFRFSLDHADQDAAAAERALAVDIRI
jgi:hypothetical protein